jgi:hypothetical protein
MAHGEYGDIRIAQPLKLFRFGIALHLAEFVGRAANHLEPFGAEQRGNAVEQVDLPGITADENPGQFRILRWIEKYVMFIFIRCP